MRADAAVAFSRDVIVEILTCFETQEEASVEHRRCRRSGVSNHRQSIRMIGQVTPVPATSWSVLVAIAPSTGRR